MTAKHNPVVHQRVAKPINWKGSFPLCPYCNKLIQAGDKVCQWCQSEVDA